MAGFCPETKDIQLNVNKFLAYWNEEWAMVNLPKNMFFCRNL